ncbi:MAG: outer membrane protein transport protein [Planctomycetota bacterium]
MFKNIRHLCACAGLAATPAALGQVGGLYLPENGGPASGTAMAGQAATARDAQTAWLNPAGMTRLENPEIMVSVMPFYLDLQFNPSSATTIPGSDGGQQGGWLPGAGLFLAAPVNDRVAFGFSVTAPAGLILDPDDSWAGRSYLTEATVAVLNFQPSFAFQATDELSFGVGVDVQYATLEMDFGLPGGGGGPAGGTASIDGDNWEVGASLGVLWEPSEKWRLGARYRTAMDHELGGDFTIVAGQQASTSFTMPQSLTFSLHHQVSEKFAVMADAGWTDWSAFKRTVINTEVAGFEIDRNWRDVYNVGLGLHYRPADEWLVMAGFGFATSAVSDENRTPDLPTDRQFRLSVGLEYEVSDAIRVGGTFTYLNMGDNRIDQSRGPGRLAGSYDADAYLIGLYAAFGF